MLIAVYRAISFYFIVLLLLIFCKSGDAAQALSEGIEETPKELIEPTRDIRQGAQIIEAGATKDDSKTVGANPAEAELNHSLIEEESLSPLLTRDYLAQFDIPIVFNEAVDYFVRYFTVQKRKVFVNWLKRSRRYAPAIRSILREQGLPEDLVYLAMIESGFNPKAYSPMKACGPWQFIYETGERYGLRVNYWVDERRDPQKSTIAAARYLKDLFNQFGCWYLAAAGYNAGEKRIERAIAKHETNDFWELRKFNTLPRETREYIPQLIAAAIIAKDPEKFGLSNIPFDAPIPSAIYKVPGGTPFSIIAEAANYDVVALHSLNPEILRGITPPGDDWYSLRLPRTVEGEAFGKRLKTALENGSRVLSVTTHVANRRDTLATITKRYRIDISALMLVNSSTGDFRVKPGSLVYIPRFERSSQSKEAERAEIVEDGPISIGSVNVGRKDKNESCSSLRRGGRLPDIARRARVDAGALGETNALRTDKAGRKGEALLVSRTTKNATASGVDRSEARVKNRSFHVVRKGEKLVQISEKYGVDVATLRKVNKLKGDRIVPNMRLEITADVKAQAAPKKTDQVRPERSRPVRTRLVQPRDAHAQSKLYHVVRKGEKITDISEKYSVNVSSLKKMNGLKSDGLRPGMRLKVASR